MDDLLDLSWSAPKAPSVNQPSKKAQEPRDAFAGLLNTSPKPVDKSKLSLIEQQRLQQQQQRERSTSNSSPWLTPTQASTPPLTTTPLSATPISSSPSYSSVPISAVKANNNNTSSLLTSNQPSKPAATSSFEDLLNPFGSNSKRSEQGRNTPLNQLRSQTNSVDSSQWNFDLLDSKVSNTNSRAASESPVQHSLDPFDMDSLVKETKAVSSPSPAVSHTQKQVVVEEEDDNPLGILAEPARPRSAQKVVASRSPSPPPTMKSHQSPAQHHDDSTSGSRLTLTEEEEDAMLVQLIDMGFSLQESKFAIEATGGGTLQAAVDLLVQSSETVQRRQPSVKQSTPRQQNRELSQTERASAALFSNDVPPPSSSSPRRQQQQDTTTSQQDSLQQQTEKIVNQAQEFGGFLYKNASSFLKTGREKVTKAVGDWQEQQRTARMNQMKEEQSGSVRPKWMVDGDDAIDVTADSKGMEKFADDDDSDNENDLEAERRKIQEMRRLQEQKQREAAAAAHKARQQKNSRKEALIFEEEVYVSPSRRRGGNTPSSSGRSTPKPTGSPQMQQQQQQAPVAQRTASQSPKKRTRPVITAPSDIMAKVNEARTQGNEKFKLGQFGEAEEFYTRAIEILPVGHDHHVLLSNNRATTRLKIGNYKKCVEDCDIAISLARDTGGEASSVSEGVTIQWRDQMIKSLYRKAEALENIEKYKEALATYDELVKLEGVGNPKVNQGMSRCRQALNPKKPVAVSKKAETSSTSQSHQEKKQDFMSMFDPSTKSSSSASTPVVNQEELSKSKAVAAMRASAAKQEAEDAEKLEKTDEVNARLIAWKVGKEQNLRALLATLDTLLWPGAQWKGAQMSELINPKKCKITYMKAIGKVHPDKLPSDVTVEQRMLASGIFATLNEAWDSFKGQNQM